MVRRHLEIQPRVPGGNQVMIHIPPGTSDVATSTRPGPYRYITRVKKMQSMALRGSDPPPICSHVPIDPETGRTVARFTRHTIGRQLGMMSRSASWSRWQRVAIQTDR